MEFRLTRMDEPAECHTGFGHEHAPDKLFDELWISDDGNEQYCSDCLELSVQFEITEQIAPEDRIQKVVE